MKALPLISVSLRLACILFVFTATASTFAAGAETIVSPAYPYDLAVSFSGELFWTELPVENCPPPYTINTISPWTTSPATVLSGCNIHATEIRYDGAYAYFFDEAHHNISRMWRGGGSNEVRSLASTTGTFDRLGNIAIDSSYVYWGDDAGIHRVSQYAGLPQTIISAPVGYHNLGYSLTIDNAYVYWTEGPAGNRSIVRAPIRGGAIQTLLAGLADPKHLAVDSTDIYWADPGARIRHMPKAGGDWTAYNSANAAFDATGVVADDTHVYWTQSTTSPTDYVIVKRSPKYTVFVEDIATGRNPGLLRQDRLNVYWNDPEGIKRLAKSSTGITVDFRLLAMEISQGIQSLANNVPLVQDKPTIVRVYPTAQLTGVSNFNTTVVLHGTRAGGPLPGSPLTANPANFSVANGATVDRLAVDKSFNFILPPSWRSGTITLRAEINPAHRVPETSFANNSITNTVAFTRKGAVCLTLQPITTRDVPSAVYTVRSPGFNDVIRRFTTMFPTARVELHSLANPDGPWDIPGQGDNIIVSLVARYWFSAEVGIGCSPGSKSHLVGMVHPSSNTSNQQGFANFVVPVSYVKMVPGGSDPFNTPRGGGVMAQEVAHNYNGWPYFPANETRWQHVACGTDNQTNPNYPYPTDRLGPIGTNAYFGFDIGTMTPIAPDYAKDFMSYCGPEWVSDYTWRGLFNVMETLSGAASPALKSTGPAGPVSETLLLFGEIQTNGLFHQSLPAYRFAPELVNPVILGKFQEWQSAFTFAEASYAADFVAGDGSLLASQPFEAFEPHTHHDDAEAEAVHLPIFFLAVPFPPGTAAIKFRHKTEAIGSLPVSAHAPVVQVLQPNGGESYSTDFVIKWAGADLDGDALRYTVQYSTDAGSTWQALAMNYGGTEWTQQVANLPGGTACLIRVLATDGVNTGFDVSDKTFAVTGKAPTVWIDSPRDQQLVRAGEPVLLTGGGYDLEDGTLQLLQWSIAGIGSVGTGNEVILPELPPGDYTVFLDGIDQAQNKVSTSVNISVTLLGEVPRVKVERRLKELVISWPVLAAGYVLESASDLGANANWAPATETQQLDGDDLVIATDNAGPRRFFRLRQVNAK